jgi:chlorobactene glucosyltransferase
MQLIPLKVYLNALLLFFDFISTFVLFVVIVVTYFSLKGIPSFVNLTRSKTKLEEKVSVIIPVKNEADTISSCLSSIVKLDYPNKEIIVVCGKSDDGTEEIVKSFPVKLVEETEPPDGWVGKNWACHLGYISSSGRFLLFTDGDVVHEPESLSSAIEFMEKNKLDMLSCWPKIVTRSLSEAIVLPIGYFLLSLGVATVVKTNTRFGKSIKGANGQFILVRRESYMEIGGHESVKSEILEDAALGRRAVESGLNVKNVKAGDILSVYPYSCFDELKRAFQRFGATIVRKGSFLAGLFTLHILYFLLPPVLFLLSLFHPLYLDNYFMISSVVSFLLVSLNSLYFYRMNSHSIYFILFPVGALVACILYTSGFIQASRGIYWKGRVYKTKK